MTTKPIPRGELERKMGAIFRDVRRRQKVSLRAVAEQLACSVNTVRWHEAGARPLRSDDLVKAAAIIGVDPGELLVKAPKKRKRRTKNDALTH